MQSKQSRKNIMPRTRTPCPENLIEARQLGRDESLGHPLARKTSLPFDLSSETGRAQHYKT